MEPTEYWDWPRVVSLEAGVAMVVSDLHGDWDAYRRYCDRFLALQARGQADKRVCLRQRDHTMSSMRIPRLCAR